MKLLLTFLAISISACTLYAQDTYDVIHLKNGSFYKGNITEYIPEDHALIKLLDGRLVSIQTDDIQSMNVGEEKVLKKNFDIKERGYFNNTLLGPQFGNSRYGETQATFALNTVNGYKIKGHHPGIGLGLEKHACKWYAPIYAEYSYRFLKNSFRPLIGVNGGIMVPLRKDKYRESNSQYDYKNGVFAGARIGFAAYTGPHFGLLLNLTYRYIRLEDASYIPGYYYAYARPEFTGSAELHRIGVMVGILIN